jgi:hypothetical protein
VGWKLIVAVAAGLASTAPVIAIAEEKPTAPAAVSAKDLTREQFQALPPNAVIEINGESITKSAFQARNIKAVEEAAKRLPELRARARAQSDARRKRKKQAADLLEQAAKASPLERSELEKQADELLMRSAK